MAGTIQEMWLRLAQDNVSGASEIYLTSLRLLQRFFTSQPLSSFSIDAVYRQLQQMTAAQQTMAPLYNLANKIALLIEDEQADAKDSIDSILEYLQAERDRHDSITKEMAIHFSNALAKQSCILTHSHSSTVCNSLLEAGNDGKISEVIVSEARPAREGRVMAEKLASAGIPITFIVDDARASFLERADLVVIGADRVSEQMLLNKIGSLALVLLAARQMTPVSAIFRSNKLWPAHLPFGKEPDHDASEIWEPELSNIKIRNLYFEEVPLDLIQSIITEIGAAVCDDIQTHFENFPVAAFWHQDRSSG